MEDEQTYLLPLGIITITILVIFYYVYNNLWYNEISDKLTKGEKDNLKLGQQKMTEMLRQFDKFCRKHGI